MAWEPRRTEWISVSRREKELYDAHHPDSAFAPYRFPSKSGILKSGEFPVAVVRKMYVERGYDCFVSAQSKHGVPCYLLERMPGKRRNGDAAYLKTVGIFGAVAVDRLHRLARRVRQDNGLRAAGGDPDLLIVNRQNPIDRFFAEAKLENLASRYRDDLNDQQHILFPLIEAELGCDIRLVTVSVDTR